MNINNVHEKKTRNIDVANFLSTLFSQGDSGGPSMFLTEGVHYLLGVNSFVASSGCDLQFPDGVTLVWTFIEWMQTVSDI